MFHPNLLIFLFSTRKITFFNIYLSNYTDHNISTFYFFEVPKTRHLMFIDFLERCTQSTKILSKKNSTGALFYFVF